MLRLMGITREGVTGSQCRFALGEGEQRKKGKDVGERERDWVMHLRACSVVGRKFQQDSWCVFEPNSLE